MNRNERQLLREQNIKWYLSLIDLSRQVNKNPEKLFKLGSPKKDTKCDICKTPIPKGSSVRYFEDVEFYGHRKIYRRSYICGDCYEEIWRRQKPSVQELVEKIVG
jgi:uncharacterized protein with PIN domain